MEDDNKSIPQIDKPWISPHLNDEFIWIDRINIWVCKYMVSNKLYRKFKPEHDSGKFEGFSLNDDQQPAVLVSFNDVMSFCDWLTQFEHKEHMLPSNYIYRLPSDEEWTHFSRCGDGRIYPWGNSWPPTYGNYSDATAKKEFKEWDVIDDYDDGYPVSCPVQVAGENEWGLIGVGGNAYEWTFQADGTRVELRGGSWSTNQKEYLTCMNRYPRESTSCLVNFGCRIILLKT
ncbi:SUMF1/EgtB/PvdO family nonheme iron enzyme [bacterium AH-315-E10]|nr:SUMF1/EgtB/PvdO family nonheme iron enzyme [bacterium AH-315-E10]